MKRLLNLRRTTNIYYGWFIVVAALCAQMTAVAIQSHAQAVFLEPMTTDLGWSRTDFTWAQTFGTLVMSGGGFVVGSLLDAKGPRPFMLLGAVVMSASVVSLSQVDSVWQFLLLRGVGITLGSLMLGNLVVNTRKAHGRDRDRPGPLSDEPFRHFRHATAAGGLWPAAGRGGEVELKAPQTRRHVVTAATEVQWTRAEAVRTKAFWLLIISFGLASFSLGAFFLHLIAYFQDSGFSSQAAAARFSTAILATVLSRPLWGSLMQRFPPRYCASLGFATISVCTAGIVLALNAESSLLLYMFLIGWGLGFGGFVPLQELIWATYFGRENIGKVRSIALPLLGVATAVGPQFAAWIYDATGSYDTAFVAFAATSALAAFCVVVARPPAGGGRATTTDRSRRQRPAPAHPKVGCLRYCRRRCSPRWSGRCGIGGC